MARVHSVKKAMKDYPEQSIKKGEAYYWWKFRFGGKHKSKTYPKQSQLTQSAFLGTMYDLQDELEGLKVDTLEELRAALEDLAARAREAGEECQNSFDNMPEGLQQGETGQLLEQRVENCETLADGLEQVDTDFDAEDFDEDSVEKVEGEPEEQHKARVDEAKEAHEEEQIQAEQDKLDEALSEAQALSYEGE